MWGLQANEVAELQSQLSATRTTQHELETCVRSTFSELTEASPEHTRRFPFPPRSFFLHGKDRPFACLNTSCFAVNSLQLEWKPLAFHL